MVKVTLMMYHTNTWYKQCVYSKEEGDGAGGEMGDGTNVRVLFS